MMLMNDMAICAFIVDGKKTPTLAPEFQRPVGSIPPAQPAHLSLLGTPRRRAALPTHGYQLHNRGLAAGLYDCDRDWLRLDRI